MSLTLSCVNIRFASEAWPRPGLAEPRSALIAGLETRDFFHQHIRKGKTVMTKTSRYKKLILGLFLSWYDFWRRNSSACLSFEIHGAGFIQIIRMYMSARTVVLVCIGVFCREMYHSKKIALFWLLLVVGETFEAETFVRFVIPRLDHCWLWLLQDRSITVLAAGRRRGPSRCRLQNARSALATLTSRPTDWIHFFVRGRTSSKRGAKKNLMYS